MVVVAASALEIVLHLSVVENNVKKKLFLPKKTSFPYIKYQEYALFKKIM